MSRISLVVISLIPVVMVARSPRFSLTLHECKYHIHSSLGSTPCPSMVLTVLSPALLSCAVSEKDLVFVLGAALAIVSAKIEETL